MGSLYVANPSVLLIGQFVAIIPAARAWMNEHSWVNDVLQDTVYLLAALLVLTRAIVVRQDRGAWLLMAGGLSSYAAGTVYWVAVLVTLDPPRLFCLRQSVVARFRSHQASSLQPTPLDVL